MQSSPISTTTEPEVIKPTPSVLMQMLIPDERNEVSLSLIKPFIGIRDMHMLSCVQKGHENEIYNKFFFSKYTQRLWIDIAVRITADPITQFIPEQTIERLIAVQNEWMSTEDDKEVKLKLFETIRALVCPWTTTKRMLPVSSMLYNIPRDSRMFVVTDEATKEYRLVFQAREPGDNTQSSCPSRNKPGFGSEVVYSEPLVPMDAVDIDFSEELQRRMLTSTPFALPDFSMERNSTHVSFPVHGSVFGVMEFYPHGYVRMNEGEAGIYFFDYTGRFLRYMTMPRGMFANDCSIRSRPFNMWFHLNGTVEHSYSKLCCGKQSHNIIDLGTKTERMVPAVWMAARGNVDAAMEFMRRDMGGLGISRGCAINERTMLHYAAQEGQIDTVRRLLAMDADARVRDFNADTPLILACERMRHEVVHVLIEADVVEPRDIKNAWSAFCSMGQSLLHVPHSAEMARHHCRVQTPKITRSLLSAMEPHDGSLLSSLVNGFKSPDIIASSEAMRIIFEVGGTQIRDLFGRSGAAKYLFPTFRSDQYIHESLDTIRLVYGEMKMDVNRPQSIDQEPPIIWAVRKGSVDAVRIMIEELGADVKARSEMGNGLKTEAAMRCIGGVGYRDIDGEMILDYLNSLPI